jgi:phage protein D
MPPPNVVTPAIKIDGIPLDKELIPFLEETVVDDKEQVPSMFTLTFVDKDHDVISRANAKIGATVEIKSAPLDEPGSFLLIKGEVTALEADYDVTGARAIIRGYDLSHRLHRGRHTETYVQQSDSDIAKKIASRHGIQVGTVQNTSVSHDHRSQANMSDWDFLNGRAKRIGYELSVVDGKLNFKALPKAAEAPAPGTLRSTGEDELVFGTTIIEFHPRITAAAQVKAIKVRGWDAQAKKEIIGTAQAATVSATLGGAFTPAAVASAVNVTHEFVAVDRPVFNQAAANDAAAALAEQIGSAFAEADGVAIGDPRIVAGKPISIGGVSSEFKGKWVISHARHVINNQGYRIHFSASGRHDRSLLGLTSHGVENGSSPPGRPKNYGLVVGIVTNSQDDKKQGRVKVRFPWLADKGGQETYESNWARLVSFGAGPDRGAVFIPEVNDEVLVGFLHGDVNYPYVIGGLYNGQDKPNLGIAENGSADDVIQGGKVGRRGFTSRKGHALVFVDDDGANDGIVLRSSDGKLKIELKAKGKELHISGDTKVIVTAEQELTLESKKDINIKAQGNLKLEAATGVDMKSNAAFKIQGTTVDVKASTSVSVSGTPIKLN